METADLITEIQTLHRSKIAVEQQLEEAVETAKAEKRRIRDRLAVLQDELDAVRKVELAQFELAVKRGEANLGDVPDVPSRASVFASLKE